MNEQAVSTMVAELASEPSAPRVDLRGEVMTPPTEAMWDAMRAAAADVGWVLKGEDPWVNALQARCAELTGQEAGLFVPTTSAANLLAMMTFCRPGEQLIMEARCHLFWVEQRNVSALSGAAPRLVPGDRLGHMPLDQLERAITDIGYGYLPRTAAVALENTHNVSGGTCLEPDYINAVVDLAHANGAAVFCDGARLFNAAVALGVPATEIASPLDAVTMSLNKGLGAPYGAMLCGGAEVIERARYHLRTIASHSVHRSGIFAAAALVGLEQEMPQLARDHASARTLAQRIAEVEGLRVDLETVQTNIVRVEVPATTPVDILADRLYTSGVGCGILEHGAIKFVTHRGFDPMDADFVAQALDQALGGP